MTAISLKQEFEIVKKKTHKPLLYVGMLSMVMLFAGLTSAYIVRAEESDWVPFALPGAFNYSTIAIVLSSITMIMGQIGAKRGNKLLERLGLTLTFGLGIVFVYFQFGAWNELVDNGIYFTGPGSNVSGSFLYVITLVHVMHLIGGILAISITTINSLRNKYNSENYLGIEMCSIYWHFLDALWIYLLLFLIYIN